MSIFKEPFKEELKKQLEKRQEAMVNRTLPNLTYINGRNAWIRMSSAVNVYKDTAPTPPTKADLKNEGYYDNSLAKKYILQGGCLNENGTLKGGVGVDFYSAYSRQSAEGIDYRLGIRPMPGITNMEVKSRGAYGSLRTVTVNFQCWDIHQLEDLELLYMRPGYTVLVEWGWAPYLDNNGNLKSTVEFYDIVNQVKPKETIWKELDEKMNVDGNYEAMFGYIKNYSWNARPDGGYDCSTEIISLGEIIESLKINYVPSALIRDIKEKGLITPNLKKTTLANLNNATSLPDLTDDEKEKLEKAYNQSILTGLFYELYTAAEKADPGTEDDGQEITFNDTQKESVYTLFHKTINMNNETKEDDSTIGESDEQYYISLESLVNVLNNYVLLRDQKSQTQFAPLTILDTKFKGIPNYTTGDGYLLALAHPIQISIDPRVCLIKNMLWANGININLVSGGDPTRPGFTAGQGDPVIQFNHNLGTAAQVRSRMSTYIYIAGASKTINNKQALTDNIKNWLQGPPESRRSAAQVEQNLKEASAMYVVLYNESERGKFKIKRPADIDISTFGLEINDKKIGQSISNAIDGFDPKTFQELLNDFKALNLSQAQVNDIITPEGGDPDKADEIADSDPVQKEQEKLEDQKEELDDLAEDAKKGTQFLKNIPLPYYVNNNYDTELGIIGNIFINLRMLYEMSLDGNLEAQDKKEKNEIALYDFVKNLMSKVSEAIGNVNNFDVFIDNNVAKIIDVNFVTKEDPETIYKNLFELQLHNLKSTVRSYKLESKIFPEQGNIVAIGAQVGGGALGTDTTSLVAFNKNIVDRIIPIKDAPTDDLISNDAQAKADALLENLKTLYLYFGELDFGIFDDSDFDVEKASGYSNALRDLINTLKTIAVSKSSNKAILPTVLSVDMDGIGGLIIGTLFKVPLDILPKGYKGTGNGGIGSNLGYVITGIGHTVGNGDWVTKIDAQTIILDSPQAELRKINYSNITINVNPTTEKQIVQPTPPNGAATTTGGGTPPKGNTNTGGTTKTFNGKVYKNGQVDELLVRMDLTLERQHKTSVCQSDGAKVRLQAKAMQNLEKMLRDAKAAGVHIGINSAYRTYEDQVRIKVDSARTGIPAAAPGRSNHGFGLAVDLGNAGGTRINPNKTPKEWKWIQANKYKYSFENINNTNESHHYNFYG